MPQHPDDAHPDAPAAGGPPEFPPILYVPCAEPVTDPARARVEFRMTRDGRKALLVYSALDRLHAGVGKDQPWFVAPTAGLQALYEVDPFDLVLLDILVPDEHRWEAPETGQASGSDELRWRP